jgi:hypothetical protein
MSVQAFGSGGNDRNATRLEIAATAKSLTIDRKKNFIETPTENL